MRISSKLLVATAAAGLVAAGGTAFTNSNTMPAADVTLGYGSQSVSGVTAESITYNKNTAEDTITSVNLVLTGNTTGKTIQLGWNDTAGVTCSGTGTYTAGTDDTAYTCTVSQSVGTAVKFALIAE